MGILKFLFLELASWIVKGVYALGRGYLKVTGQWVGLDQKKGARIRELARMFHLNHYPVILSEDNARQCSACHDYETLIVEPHGLCSVCWCGGLEKTQKELRQALGYQQA